MDSGSYRALCSRITLQNKNEGFFRQLVDQLSFCIRLDQFSNCKTDLERIKFCAERLWDMIGAELIFKGKHLDDAITRRLEGNQAFKSKEYQKALLLYCQSIIRCPVGPELALTYSNRSALFQEMKEWELCIRDIEMAISYSYPEENRHKLYERMAVCHVKLSNAPKAKVSINLAKHFASKYSRNDNKLLKKLEKLSLEVESINKQQKSNVRNEHSEVLVFAEPNSKFTSASPKFDVKSNNNDGRFAFAKDEIAPGEDILVEEPNAAVLLPERFGTHCTHCFKKLQGAIACETCANVAFCSKSCRTLAEAYHQYECRIALLLQGSGMSAVPYLALRLVTQNSATYFIENFSQFVSNPNKILLEDDSRYDSKSYKNIYNLVALESQRDERDFLERTIMALFLMKCLRITGYFDINLFKNPQPTENELKIGSLILRNLQVLQFNSYEISEFLIDTKEAFKKSKLYNIGLGIYPIASFVNHSCAPNVTRYFTRSKIYITAIQCIQNGEAISDSYGPIFTKVEKTDRQHKLEGRYWFNCNCGACLDSNEEKYKLLTNITDDNIFDEITKQTLEKLKEKYFDPALKYMDTTDKESAIDNLIQYLKNTHLILANKQILGCELKSFVLAQEALKLCLCAKGTVYFVDAGSK